MEYTGDEKIISIANKIINLLNSNDEPFWGELVSNILKEYKKSSNKEETASLFIKIMRGGMGSFLDVVLHKDGIPLKKENNELYDLRHQLYDTIVQTYPSLNSL